MADNITLPGDGSIASTDDRGSGGHVQRVEDVSASSFANGQVSVTTTAGTLLAARTNRKLVTFINHGTNDIYVGAATVTTGNGVKIEAGAAFDFHSSALLQAITATGTSTVHYLEYFDS